LQCTGRNQPSHQLRNPARVIAIVLDRHRPESIAHVARLQELNPKTRRPHRRIEPLRQRAGLQADPLKFEVEATEPGDQRLRLARNPLLPDDLASPVHHANARVFQ